MSYMLNLIFSRFTLFCTLLQFCAGQFLTNQLCNQCCEVKTWQETKNQENHFFHFLAMRTRIYYIYIISITPLI